MKLHLFYAYALSLSCALFPVMTAGCSHENHDGHDHESAEEKGHEEKEEHAGEGHGNEVVMSHEAVKSAGIVTESVSPGDFRDAVKAAGTIESSRGAQRVVSAPASGIVSFSSGIVAGSPVSTGQPLFTISSKGLEQADPTAALQVDVEAARRQLERADKLIGDNLMTRKEYEEIRAAYDRAVAAASTVGARTARATGVSSPMGGYLVSVSVAPGAFVNMGEPLAVVAADRRLLLRAELSERHRGFAHLVTGANILPPGADAPVSLAALSPRVLSANPASDGGSHFFPVYIEFDNPGSLGSGSVVEAWLLGPLRSGVISVPRSTLVEEGGFFYVYVKEPDEHEVFRKTEVTTGATDGRRVEILSGLKAGDEVVTEGALRIRMAGMGSSIQGHSHHH